MKPRLILLISILASYAQGFSSHVLGGYISYKYDTLNRFEVFIHIYRDCRGFGLEKLTNNDFSILFLDQNDSLLGKSVSIPMQRISISDMSIIQNGRAKPCSPLDTVSEPGFEVHLYKVNVDFDSLLYRSLYHSSQLHKIILAFHNQVKTYSGTPPEPIYFETQIFIRNQNGILLPSNNSSPESLMHHSPFACCNIAQIKDHGMQDTIEFDSTKYILSPRKIGYKSVYSYPSPFSYKYPITPYCVPPGNVSCSRNNKTTPPRGFYLDTNTGRIEYTPTKCDETGVIYYQVNEYRKVDKTYELISIVDCMYTLIVVDNCGANNLPFIKNPTHYSTLTFVIEQENNFRLESTDQILSPQNDDTTSIFFPNAPEGTTFLADSSLHWSGGTFSWTPGEEWYSRKFKLICAVKDAPSGPHPTYSTSIVNINFRGKFSNYSLFTFMDKNNNGKKDSSEVILPNVKMGMRQSNGKIVYVSSDANGVLRVPVFSGFKTLHCLPASNWFNTLPLDTLRFFGVDTIMTGYLPLHTFPIVRGTLYFDFNQNCKKDGNDFNAQNVQVFTTNSSNRTSDQGEFTIYLDTLINKIEISNFKDNDTCADKLVLTNLKLPLDTIIALGEISIRPGFDLSTSLSVGPVRRGSVFLTSVRIDNNSVDSLYSFVDSQFSTLKLIYPKGLRLMNTLPGAYIDSTNHCIQWHINNIPAFENSILKSTFYTSPDSFATGQTLVFKVLLDSSFSDDNERNHNNYLKTAVIGPYDPNQKLQLSADSICTTENIIYHIDFQNFGNDTAFQVVVVDTLDAALDPASVALLTSSSPCEIKVARGIVVFTLPEAQLTDTFTDKEKSKGYVSFQARLRTTVNKTQHVPNTASIYFDYEKPVKTNSVNLVVLPNTEMQITDSFFCRSETLRYSYRNNILRTATSCRLELDKAGGDFKNPTILDKFIHQPAEQWIPKTILMPDSLGSGNYQLRIVPEAWTDIGFLDGSAVFIIEKQEPEWQADLELCKGEQLDIKLLNGSSGDIYINDSLMSSSVSTFSTTSENTFKSLRINAESKNQCPWVLNESIAVTPLPEVKINAPEFACFQQSFQIKVPSEYSYTIYQNKQTKYKEINDSTFLFQPDLQNTLRIIATNTNGCTDSADIVVQQRSKLSFSASVPSIDCAVDSVLLTLNGNYLYSVTQSGKILLANFSGNNVYLKPYNRGTLYVTASDSFDCVARDSLTFPQKEHYDLNLVLTKNPICAYDSASLKFSGMPKASLLVNGNNAMEMTENAIHFFTGTVGNYELQLEQRSDLGCLYRSNKQHLVVSPTPPTPQITVIGDTLFSSAQFNNYWYFNSLATGDTLAYHVAQQDGIYQVENRNESGCSAYSATVNVNWTSIYNLRNTILVYPNPFEQSFVIQSEKWIDHIFMFDALGNKVYSQNLSSGEREITVSSLSAGVYCLRLIFDSGESQTFWIQKN